MPTPDPDPTASLRLAVDRNSPVPLYFQLSRQLESAIAEGTLAAGSLLGNEIALAARLGLSRPTVRQAIQTLVDKGLLVRRRGVGTQVVQSTVRRPLELRSLYEDLAADGRGPTTRVLANAVVPAPPEAAAALGVAAGDPVRRIERLRYAHGEPLARLCNHLPVRLPGLDDESLEAGGLYALLRAAGVTLHSARQRIGAHAASPEEAGLLAEETGAPLLTMERTAFDDTGRPVEFGVHQFRASRYCFDFQLLVRP
ncbi:GntR family transcriptional regulator [Streptomyces sp. NA04227]|uniref:GntR family transcriptional regulator n=1 Tax=Streptomyces sp. NA04227 TaxID=2742136 RepID=UPI001591DC0E|nr:GntR family transcriptional regulator [Streptomyces sp. NA04227]QKW10098.1 GntR family transcriptional regulator [Streptomyces sp. NA04227]